MHRSPNIALGLAMGPFAWSCPAVGQCTPVWTGLGLAAGGVKGTTRVWGVPGWGGPSEVAAAGGLVFPGNPATLRVALWDGWSWAPLPEQVIGTIEDLQTRQPPIAPGVYFWAGGDFAIPGGASTVDAALWSTGAWSALGTGLSPGSVFALHWCDAPPPLGPKLYAGGQFSVAGSAKARGVAAWNGASWEALGTGLAPAVVGQSTYAYAFALYDDDRSGPRLNALYVAGYFASAGGIAADSIARWDGATWEPLAEGTDNLVRALCVFDPDGPGPIPESLFAGGPGVNYNGLTRWDGQQWHAVPGWGGNSPHAMAVFDDDGPGPNKPALFIGGLNIWAGGLPVNHIVKWDGQTWQSVGGGITQATVGGPVVHTLEILDEDGPGPNPGGLYVGGGFSVVGGSVSTNGIARWGCPLPPHCPANCNLSVHPTTGAHTLSIADFACFQTRYVLSDPWADCNTDGSLSISDFACFQSRFVAGCP